MPRKRRNRNTFAENLLYGFAMLAGVTGIVAAVAVGALTLHPSNPHNAEGLWILTVFAVLSGIIMRQGYNLCDFNN